MGIKFPKINIWKVSDRLMERSKKTTGTGYDEKHKNYEINLLVGIPVYWYNYTQ